MRHKLIYKDENRIEDWLWGYNKGVAKLQSIIDKLSGLGLTLTDGILTDLYSGGYATKEATQDQIDEELARLKFQASKDELKKKLKPLFYKIDDAANEVRGALNVARGPFTVHIELENIVVKDLKVSATPDLKEIITEQFSIYADNPAMAEAYQRALKLEKEVNEYQAFLRQHGDALKPVGIKSLYGHADNSILGVKPDGTVEIQSACFQSLFAKRRRTQ